MPVVAMDHRLRTPGGYSRYITQRWIEEHEKTGKSDKVGSDSKWHFSSAQALERLHAPGLEDSVLIPSNDDYLMLVSRNYESLASRYVLTTPPWDILGPLMDKEQIYAMAAQAGIEVPEFFLPATLAEARDIIAGLNFEHRSYIFKLHPWASGPADPVSGAMTRPAGGTANDALDRYQEVFDRTGQLPLIQEVVPGTASVCIGVSLLADRNQRVLAAYTSQRTQMHTYSTGGEQLHPYELGANLSARSIEDSEALDLAARLVEISGIYGVLTVEFRRSRYDGRLKLIKVDPRHVNAAVLGRTVGLDLPWLQYRYFCDMPVAPQAAYALGKQWVWPDRWLRLFLRNKQHRLIKVRQLLGLLVRARSIGYFSVMDPRPFLRALKLEWSRRRKDAASGRLYSG